MRESPRRIRDSDTGRRARPVGPVSLPPGQCRGSKAVLNHADRARRKHADRAGDGLRLDIAMFAQQRGNSFQHDRIFRRASVAGLRTGADIGGIHSHDDEVAFAPDAVGQKLLVGRLTRSWRTVREKLGEVENKIIARRQEGDRPGGCSQRGQIFAQHINVDVGRCENGCTKSTRSALCPRQGIERLDRNPVTQAVREDVMCVRGLPDSSRTRARISAAAARENVALSSS